MPSSDGGLGAALVGERIDINGRAVGVTKLLGEGKSDFLPTARGSHNELWL